MTRKQWEYLVLEMKADPADIEKRLTNLGSQGWELVAVGVYTMTHTVYLKRHVGYS